MDIVTLTVNPTIDTSSQIDYVTPDKKLRCKKPVHEPGGGGINVSRAIKKLDGESLAIFPSGGANGQHLIQLLEKEKVDISTIEIEDSTRENFSIDEAKTNKNFRFVMPGPKLKENEWKAIIDKVNDLKDKPSYLVASGSLPKGVPDDFYAQLADCCEECGIKMIIDTSGKPLKKVMNQGVYILKPNMRELNDMLGKEIEDDNELVKEVQGLIKDKYAKYIVLSLGSGGAMLISKDGYKYFRTPTVQIKSKVGAGDCMVAGIVLRLSRGKEIEEAVKYGIAAGASAVSTPGSELCKKETVEKLFKKIS